jgi:chemotaxis response regulator CheB
MANRNVVAIGTSAGGFEVLRFLARAFDLGFSSFDPDNDSRAA